MTTAQFEERVQTGRAVLMSSDEVIAIGGGVPIVEDGRVIGALGVSGGTAVQDAQIAAAAIVPDENGTGQASASIEACAGRPAG
jgi:glc operon protein GlcG